MPRGNIPAQLSGGMIKRAALARALALDPQLLMLDEPTAGLDPISAAAFDELLMDLRQQLGLTVIMITHDLDTIFRTCNRVGVIIDRKMTSDTLEGITRNPHPWIQAYFHGERAQRFGQGHETIMEREANYTAVGAFVLLIATMAGLFVYWYAGSGDARDYKRYEIYFEGSVSGLNRGSTVRYLGVDVGRVIAIRIDKRASDRVQIIADIDSTTPISEGHAGITLDAGRDRPALHRPAGEREDEARHGLGSERTISRHRFSAIELRPLAREPARSGRPRHGGRRPRCARVVGRKHQGLREDHAEHRADVGDAARRDARCGSGDRRSQGNARRRARRGNRRPPAHRNLGPESCRGLRAHPLDLRKPREDHGEPRSPHGRPS